MDAVHTTGRSAAGNGASHGVNNARPGAIDERNRVQERGIAQIERRHTLRTFRCYAEPGKTAAKPCPLGLRNVYISSTKPDHLIGDGQTQQGFPAVYGVDVQPARPLHRHRSTCLCTA